MKKTTQIQRVCAHLQRGSITPMQAFSRYQITCLAERIRDLRKRGFSISSKMVTQNGKTFARYSME